MFLREYNSKQIEKLEKMWDCQWRCSGVLIANFENIFTTFCNVPFIDFEKTNVCWVIITSILFFTGSKIKHNEKVSRVIIENKMSFEALSDNIYKEGNQNLHPIDRVLNIQNSCFHHSK